ncbi:hypothetical protein BT96DRAFT_984222 [Gymnopus androsaceus JB14]|uniref:Uncharacterized protein n=1 Tax=Gymnopus androsaceus JB14 TaxID=1447944 RepID=A0A6A4IM09_9AGAR|nr:hypothetical protein BT96DRAFT_984222 [Gymnopus androsaceus JB14]
MAQYLSQSRIEQPIWPEPNDISLLKTRISEAEAQLENLDAQISELMQRYETYCRPFIECRLRSFELTCLPDYGFFDDDTYVIFRYPSMFSRAYVAWRIAAAQAIPRVWPTLCLSYTPTSVSDASNISSFLTPNLSFKENLDRSRTFVALVYELQASCNFLNV